LLSSTPIASSIDYDVALTSQSSAGETSAAAAKNAASPRPVVAESMKSFAWADDGEKVKIYVNLSGIGEHSEEKIVLINTELSFSLTVVDYCSENSGDDGDGVNDDEEEDGEEDESGEKKIGERKGKNLRLKMISLFARIEKCTMKIKKDKIIVTLKKSDGEQSWPCLGKGQPSS
jgi:hypothetical protein